MKLRRLSIYLFLLFLAASGYVGYSNSAPIPSLIAQYTYEGPNQQTPNSRKLVRIEILVRDSPDAGGVQIHSVEFNQKNIPLKPRDIYGNRGSASFQLLPGKYKLRWVVQKDKFEWPRLITHDQEVIIDPRDLWIQVYIEGNDASVR